MYFVPLPTKYFLVHNSKVFFGAKNAIIIVVRANVGAAACSAAAAAVDILIVVAEAAT